MSTNGGATYSSIDADIFTFETSTAIILSTNSTDSYKAGVYTFMVVGTLSSYANANMTFNVTVLPYCYDAVLTTTAISEQTYTINNTQMTFIITPFETDIPYCGTFTYVVEIISPTAATLPTNYLSYSSYVFDIYTESIADAGNYTVNITGT
jgi:hypothetical protein